MSVFYKFQSDFEYMLNAPDRETGNKLIDYELGMSNDFVEQLTKIRNAPTRVESDKMIRDIMFGKHEKFAPELAEIMEALEGGAGHKMVDILINKMHIYIDTLTRVKNAATREEGDEILRAALEDSKIQDLYNRLDDGSKETHYYNRRYHQ